MNTPAPIASPKPAPASATPGWSLRAVVWALAALLLSSFALLALALWLMRSEPGTRWLLARTPGLAITRTEGALLGRDFSAEGVRWRDPLSGASVQIDRLSWHGARWSVLPGTAAWLSVQVDELQLGAIHWTSASTSPERLRPPQSLRSPIDLDIGSLVIASLQLDALEPARDIRARLSLGRQAGSEHRLELTQLHWHHIELQGIGSIKADAPHALDVRLSAQARQGVPWNAQAELQGPLSSSTLDIKVNGQAIDRGPDPGLDARAQIRPFEAWALGAVDVTTHQLDLASLLPGAPRTRLSGHATIRSQGLREPISADIQLDNAAPARLSDGGLPILSLKAVVKTNPRQPERLDIGPFVLEAADARGAAGRWSGSGAWVGSQLQLQTRLADLQPTRLDQRMAAMQLGGPLNLTVNGLPSPDPAQSPKQAWAGWTGLSVSVDGQLEGRVSGAPGDVQLSFSAEADRNSARVKQLVASSGAAQARLTVQLTRVMAQRWQVSSAGELKAFDPRVWFPGSQGTWGSGQQLFNGRWELDVSAPAPTTSTRLAQWLPLLLGRADVKLFDSRLAGLPLQADMELRQDSRTGGNASPSRARIDIRLASAQLQISGTGDAGASGINDRTQLRLSVPALNELAPLAALSPAWVPWSPRRGELQLQAELTGRWPELNGTITASAAHVQAGPLGLARAQLNGRFNRQRSEGLLVGIEADDLKWHEARLDALRGQLRGSLEQHQVELDLRAPLIPPATLAKALEWSQSGLARAELVGSGSWSATAGDPGLAGRWAGQLERFSVGDGKRSESAAADPSWLDIRGVRLEAQLDTEGHLKTISLQPGVARSGPLSVRWTEALWQQVPGAQPAWRLLGELEPFSVAPVLQRAIGTANSGSQWTGDLRVGAQLDLRADSRFAADVLLRREGGDLISSDGSTHTALELEKAEWRLQAKDGIWRFQPNIQGRSFGRLDGELLARAQPAQRWPSSETPIEGALEARVASLATWGRWLPTGWMLQGEMDATARLSGTWGAPGYTGSLSGDRVAVRNLLQGVDLQDGRLRVRLDGETARIETLSIRGGDGQLTAQGLARFGAKPELQLDAKAEKLRVLGRVDRQLVLSGQTRLNLFTDRLILEGQIKADSGLFDLSSRDAPALDEDVVVLRQVEAPEAPPARAEPSAFAKLSRVALDLDLGQQLRLRGRGLNTGLTGKLRLTTPGGRLFFQGSVQATAGTYAAYGQKLAIERGQVVINGPLDRARLDILALRPNLDTRVGVVISGSALDPRIRLYSEPEMSETDKLSWLVLGRGPEGLGTTDTALLQRAAVALLSGDGESPSDAALRRLGLDDFSIRQSEGDVRDTVVSVGKQLGRRWYVGYERGVNATAGTWQLIYRVAQRFTLRAQSGSDNSLDIIWTWRFGQR